MAAGGLAALGTWSVNGHIITTETKFPVWCASLNAGCLCFQSIKIPGPECTEIRMFTDRPQLFCLIIQQPKCWVDLTCDCLKSWYGHRLHNVTLWSSHLIHDDVIKWKHFPRYSPFVWGIHRSPVNSPHNGQWRGAFIFLWSAPE